MMAKTMNRMTSISGKHRHQESGDQQVENSYRKQEFPGETHELVVAEARQSYAHTVKRKQEGAGLGSEPEQREQYRLHSRDQEHKCDQEKQHSEDRQGLLIPPARRIVCMIEGQGAGAGENHRGHVARSELRREER